MLNPSGLKYRKICTDKPCPFHVNPLKHLNLLRVTVAYFGAQFLSKVYWDKLKEKKSVSNQPGFCLVSDVELKLKSVCGYARTCTHTETGNKICVDTLPYNYFFRV